MRILIDLQGAQTASRFRGIGRYSLALALAIARKPGEHEISILLNAALPDAIQDILHRFKQLIPNDRIFIFTPPTPCSESNPDNAWRARAAEIIRKRYLATINPDVLLITSLFEGYIDDGTVSIDNIFGDIPTATILYDLIPLTNQDTYLRTTGYRDFYFKKINSLRNSDLLLSISEYSRLEGINNLKVPDNKVVNISTAIDHFFKEQLTCNNKTKETQARIGIFKKFILYVPGGFDARKNIDGLIHAYALLPTELRTSHQLIIASKIDDKEQKRITALAQGQGIPPEDLVLTGYLADNELHGLYRSATLFVFPSLHEGFGLPVLEAMACGTPVIGSNTTSIPEVIGLEEALFDPTSPAAIAAKISQALLDEHFYDILCKHSTKQHKNFSWEISAQHALTAIEKNLNFSPRPEKKSQEIKPSLAYVSPLPPERTGIAGYSADLIPWLARFYEITLITDNTTLPSELNKYQRQTASWFSRNGHSFDRIIYHFGNSPFHTHMFDLLKKHPGVVVLHDFYLSSVLAFEERSGNRQKIWSEALYHSHGYSALADLKHEKTDDNTIKKYPCNLAVLQDATHIISHSEYSKKLAHSWYGDTSQEAWTCIPLLRLPACKPPSSPIRTNMGFDEDDFIVCSFGFLDASKYSLRLINAWIDSEFSSEKKCHLIFIGENHSGAYGKEIIEAINQLGHKKNITITGWVDTQDYENYLTIADVAIQLRAISKGETSAAILDCLNYGIPSIINANGAIAEIPDDVAIKLADEFNDMDLISALRTLKLDKKEREKLSAKASYFIKEHHHPEVCSRSYFESIEKSYGQCAPIKKINSREFLEKTGIPKPIEDLKNLAQSIAATFPPTPRAKQLLIDISSIVKNDLKTGIERVVRAQLCELLRSPTPGIRIQPIYLDQLNGQPTYRYAHNYVNKIFEGGNLELSETPIDIHEGDIYYCSDFAPFHCIEASESGIYANWQAKGVSLNFQVFDILPLLHPDFFPEGADALHEKWLRKIAENADCLICISKAVENETRNYITHHKFVTKQNIEFQTVHLGSDISSSAPTKGIPIDSKLLIDQITKAPSFLMVGTIEPRKGHLQTIRAFEELWAAGIETNLVIIGKEGWTSLPDEKRRTIPEIVRHIKSHPELGKKLKWLTDVSDEYLDKIYASASCLIFASEAEGFGLPLIEAAQHGLPVIARDLDVLREVAGESAFYFKGNSSTNLAHAISEWMVANPPQNTKNIIRTKTTTWQESTKKLSLLLNPPSK